MAALKERVKQGEEALRELQARLDALLPTFPNILADDVPGRPRRDRAMSSCGAGAARATSTSTPLPHDELGAALGMDFARAARLSGARFVVLWGQLAALERALGQFMLALQTREHGYTEVAVPYLVRDEALFGTGQLPKFGEDLFRTTTGHWLIPTAEVPLTNLVAGEILDEAQLPLRAHRADALLPLRGRCRRQGHQGHDPPAPVHQGRAGERHRRRSSPRPSTSAWSAAPRPCCSGWSCPTA